MVLFCGGEMKDPAKSSEPFYKVHSLPMKIIQKLSNISAKVNVFVHYRYISLSSEDHAFVVQEWYFADFLECS